MGEDVAGIFPARVTAATLERSPGELDDVERGTLFVPWPRPPRVGEKVQLDLAFGEDAPQRLTALVVASRPAKGPVTPGFKAALVQPNADLLTRLQRVAETARSRIVARAVERREGVELTPIVERMRPNRTVRTNELPAARVGQEPSWPAAPEPGAIELPDEDGPYALQLTPSDDDDLPPLPSREPTTPPPGFTRSPDLTSAAEFTPTPPRSVPGELTPGPELGDLPAPWRVEISSAKSYLVHFSRFLWKGEVYLARTPAPEPDSVIEVEIVVPDGGPMLTAAAVVDREVSPPEVPREGFVAKLVDLDGSHARRLKQAAILLGD